MWKQVSSEWSHHKIFSTDSIKSSNHVQITCKTARICVLKYARTVEPQKVWSETHALRARETLTLFSRYAKPIQRKKKPTVLQSKPRLLEGCYSVCDIQSSDEKISIGELQCIPIRRSLVHLRGSTQIEPPVSLIVGITLQFQQDSIVHPSNERSECLTEGYIFPCSETCCFVIQTFHFLSNVRE